MDVSNCQGHNARCILSIDSLSEEQESVPSSSSATIQPSPPPPPFKEPARETVRSRVGRKSKASPSAPASLQEMEEAEHKIRMRIYRMKLSILRLKKAALLGKKPENN